MPVFHAYMTLFLICMVTILILAFFSSKRAKSHILPGPFAFPIIGHLHLLARLPHQAFYKLSLQHGPVYRLYLGYVPCVVISSPDAAKEILKTNENSFLNRPQNNSALAYLTYGSKDFSFGNYGPYWKFMKKMVMSKLLNGATLDLFLKIRQEEINSFMKSLSQIVKNGMAIDLGGELVKVTNNVISRMVMSERCSDNENEAKEVRNLVAEITELMGNFNLSDYIWLFKNVDLQGFGRRSKDIHGRFNALIERIIKEHEEARKSGTRQVKDLLDILLDIEQDKNIETDLIRENIKALILDLFAGGTDTSASTMEWAMAELINHPNIMKKATEEIDQVVGKNRCLQESDTQNLPYLQAIVKETLRLHPTIPLITRQSTKDCIVGGYHIPAKTDIFVNSWALGRDPNYWDNPLEFIPERFLVSELDVRGQYFQMLPILSNVTLWKWEENVFWDFTSIASYTNNAWCNDSVLRVEGWKRWKSNKC